MFFKYDMLQTGWGKAEIESGSNIIVYEPSYISDPYGDMIRAVCTLIPGICSHHPTVSHSEVHWNMEPVHITISLAYNEPELTINIIEYDESETQMKKSIILKENINAHDFINDLIESGKHMLLKYGMIGYRTNSLNFEFPVSSFLKLLNYSKNNFKLSMAKSETSPLFSSCIQTELQQLTALNF